MRLILKKKKQVERVANRSGNSYDTTTVVLTVLLRNVFNGRTLYSPNLNDRARLDKRSDLLPSFTVALQPFQEQSVLIRGPPT